MAAAKPGRWTLREVVGKLAPLDAGPDPRDPTDPLELLYFENVAYIVDDETRRTTFASFVKSIGVAPAAVLRATDAKLERAIEAGGMLVAHRAKKVRKVAELAKELFGGDARKLRAMPIASARRVLKKFPGIGDPGADKVLLLAGMEARPAFDSNGLRVLLRLGLAREEASYAKAYASAVRAVEGALPAELGPWQGAFRRLRALGRTVCRRKEAQCDECPLASRCPSRGKAKPSTW